MRTLITYTLIVALGAGCASAHPTAITPVQDQTLETRRADLDACEEEVPEGRRSTAMATTSMWLISLPFAGILAVLGPLVASKSRDQYSQCLRARGYSVTW